MDSRGREWVLLQRIGSLDPDKTGDILDTLVEHFDVSNHFFANLDAEISEDVVRSARVIQEPCAVISIVGGKAFVQEVPCHRVDDNTVIADEHIFSQLCL